MTEPNAPEDAAKESAAKDAELRMAALMRLGDVNQANAATGVHGDTGTGKSTLCATAVEYAHRRYHRLTRYYTADPGGFGNKLIRLIRLGIAAVYNPTNHIEPFETVEKISMGYWPEEILDPYTGYAAPDVKLVPPTYKQWVVYCPNGHVVQRLTTQKPLNGFSIQCPECKGAPVTPQTWSKVEEVIYRSPGVDRVGLYVYDSGTALADWGMEDMARRAAANDPNIKDGNSLSATGARIVSGEFAFGANTQQHYGFSQLRTRQWIKNSRLIPGIVVPPIWTFLTQRGEAENSNMVVLGPKISGNAMTASVPSWLGNCLNTEVVTDPTSGKRHYRAWLVNHTLPGTNIPVLAKTRAEPGDLPDYLEDGDDEKTFTKFSLAYLFDRLEAVLNERAAQDMEDFPDAPIFEPAKDVSEPTVLASKDLNQASLALTPKTTRAPITATQGRPATPPGMPPKPATTAPPPPAQTKAPAAPAAPAAHVAPVAPVVQLDPATWPAPPAPPAASAAPAAPAPLPPAGRPPTPSAVRRPAAPPPPAARPKS